MNYKNKKLNLSEIVMIVATVCLLLVLVTTHMTSGLYARYSTTVSGSATVQVAKFGELTITSSTPASDQMIYIPGAPLQKSIVVNFESSEQKTFVFIEIEAADWTLTDQYKFQSKNQLLSWEVVSGDNGWTFLTTQGDSHVFYREVNYNVELNAPVIKDSTIAVSASGTMAQYAQATMISFEVTGYVVQANGFASVDAAWTSVSKN